MIVLPGLSRPRSWRLRRRTEDTAQETPFTVAEIRTAAPRDMERSTGDDVTVADGGTERSSDAIDKYLGVARRLGLHAPPAADLLAVVVIESTIGKSRHRERFAALNGERGPALLRNAVLHRISLRWMYKCPFGPTGIGHCAAYVGRL